MEAACVSDLGIEAAELRQEEIARIEGDALSEEDEACKRTQAETRGDGPGQHDGARRVQGDGGASRLPRNPAQRSDRRHREHTVDHPRNRSDHAAEIRRGLRPHQREFHRDVHQPVRRRPGLHAPDRRGEHRGKRHRYCCFASGKETAERAAAFWWREGAYSAVAAGRYFQIRSPAPSACWTKSMLRWTRPTWAGWPR